jgi:hypothetical protein
MLSNLSWPLNEALEKQQQLELARLLMGLPNGCGLWHACIGPEEDHRAWYVVDVTRTVLSEGPDPLTALQNLAFAENAYLG